MDIVDLSRFGRMAQEWNLSLSLTCYIPFLSGLRWPFKTPTTQDEIVPGKKASFMGIALCPSYGLM